MSKWKSVALSEVCQIKPPKKESKEQLIETDLVSFVPMKNLGICSKSFELSEERALGEVYSGYTYFADNDVLLAKITPCFENGKLGIANELINGIGFGSSEYIVFRVNDELDAEYLFYFLSQNSFRATGAKVMTGAVGHKRVPKEFIENYQLPLPPLPEQKRIVAILDETFAGISLAAANAEKNLANARELFESYLNNVFTQKNDEWKGKNLEDIADFKNGLNFSKISKGEKIHIVGVKDFKSNYWVPLDELDTIQIDGVLAETYLLKTDDILTVRSNGNKRLIGRCILTGEVTEKMSHSGFTIRIRLHSSDILPSYLTHYLKSDVVREILVESGGGANISSLNQKTLSKVLVYFPSKSEQNRIVANIEAFQNKVAQLETIYQQKLTALNELKQSILQKAFTGQLTKGFDNG